MPTLTLTGHTPPTERGGIVYRLLLQLLFMVLPLLFCLRRIALTDSLGLGSDRCPCGGRKALKDNLDTNVPCHCS